MRNPIKYAIFEKITDFKTYIAKDYHDFGNYHFKDFDIARYPVVKWAKWVIDKKGTYGAILNAANEEAVYAYLNDEIPLLLIEYIIEKMMKKQKSIAHPSVEQIIEADHIARVETRKMIKKWKEEHK